MRQLVRNNLLRRRVRVAEIEALAPSIRRIRLTGTDLAGFVHSPGQWIVLYTGTWRQPQDWTRNYTIRRYDPHTNSLEIVVHLHLRGPGSILAAALRPGDEVRLTRPIGGVPPVPAAEWYLLAGDESAIAAISVRLETLPPRTPVRLYLETATDGQGFTIPDRPAPVHLTSVRRDHGVTGPSPALTRAVAAARLPDVPGRALLYGETGAISSLRAHLRDERGWPRGHVHLRPHWTYGRSGM